MDYFVNENEYYPETKKQRIGRKEECCKLCVIEEKYYKTKKYRDVALKKGAKIVSNVLQKTNAENKENNKKVKRTLDIGIGKPVFVNNFDFKSGIINQSEIDEYKKKMVCETMKILKICDDQEKCPNSYHIFPTDSIMKINKLCEKKRSLEKRNRDLISS